jgi:hypothetical protein
MGNGRSYHPILQDADTTLHSKEREMKFTRAQELALIEFGMAQLLAQLVPSKGTDTKKAQPRKKKRKWSKQQRARFAKTMAAVWKRKRAEKHGKTV